MLPFSLRLRLSLETNLRTYASNYKGEPGVYSSSLEVMSPLSP
ncbi:MAG: DUF2071 domain-containing protein [Polyangiaceae bacterium]|nr:DUF2071 domain-containing protein [Polyangiaceae bacterium]